MGVFYLFLKKMKIDFTMYTQEILVIKALHTFKL